jgi:MFS family permease
MVVSLLANHTNLWPLYVLTFVTSLIGQFFIPAEGASIPLLVGEHELVPALSLFNITTTLSQAIGFLLLGGIVARAFPPFTLQVASLTLHVQSIDMLFVMVALLYLVCAVLILCIPTRALDEEHPNQDRYSGTEAGQTLKKVWFEIVEGWRYVRSDRILFFSVVQLSVVGNIMLLIGELAGTVVQQVLHHPAADMALILAPAAIGLVGASIIMPRITALVGKVRLTGAGFIMLAVGFTLLPVTQKLASYLYGEMGASSPLLLWTTMLLVFLLGLATACINIPTQTMMQEHASEEVRGRVLSLQFMMYNTGSIPILLFAGFFAQFIGLNWLIFLVSASLLLFCWWGMWYVGRDK